MTMVHRLMLSSLSVLALAMAACRHQPATLSADAWIAGAYSHASFDAELILTLNPDGLYQEVFLGGLGVGREGERPVVPIEERDHGSYQLSESQLVLHSRRGATRLLEILDFKTGRILVEKTSGNLTREYRWSKPPS